MRIALSVILLAGVALTTSCKTTVAPQNKSGGVTLYSHNGHYTMSPAPVLHSDLARIRIENVEKMKGPKDTVCTKLTYKPWYGKISSQSQKFRETHETQTVSILLNGDHTSKVKKGDILRSCYYSN